MVKTGMYSDSKVSNVIKLLNDIHFLALNNPSEKFNSLRHCILVSLRTVLQTSYPKDQYIPALKYRELPVKSKRKQQVNGFEIYPAWEIVSDKYELEIQRYIDYMPCVGVVATPSVKVEFFLEKLTTFRMPGKSSPFSL